MDNHQVNPFDLIRAADFSDTQIFDYWVDFNGDGGLLDLIEPSSKTSKHILGGKGSGKTHLMRYCSFPVQKIRHGENLLDGIFQEKYIGIFLRANILDTGRFNGKGQDESKWGPLWNYYFEVRLCEQFLQMLLELRLTSKEISDGLDLLAVDSAVLFDTDPGFELSSLSNLNDGLIRIRKEIDLAVNNCAFTRSLDVKIRISPGNLLFGLAELVHVKVPLLKGIQFLYLIDEVENFSREQQRFINSLIRHRRDPCSFRLGARLYGIKTLANYGADEENKEGSEFKQVYLDQMMRKHLLDTGGYAHFAKQLCIKRLRDTGFISADVDLANEKKVGDFLNAFFQSEQSENFYQEVTAELVKADQPAERKYFKKLRDQLNDTVGGRGSANKNSDLVNRILGNLAVPAFPLVEKINIFIFYQDWYRDEDLLESSEKIKTECELYVQRSAGAERHKRVYEHFALDLLAQLYRDYRQPTTAMYIGMDSFIRMSAGVPRNLLVILRNIYKWSSFNGERPFRDSPISITSQREAVMESAVFFYEEDARPGAEVPKVKASIDRLAEFLREVRFASKPVESSPLAFSLNVSLLSPEAADVLRQSENWSYILRIPKGRPHANSQRVHDKYQLNPAFSPKWDLPIARRGDVRLNADLAEAIFGFKPDADFRMVMDSVTASLKAPKFGKKIDERSRDKEDRNKTLELGFGDDN
ncbi:hypothetical protein HFRIS_008871 [Herbaspirillum frisingense GSF30]|uniref:Uncharacterized protein n=1 Tax=Herbaspirillum frisingense GSF30 TaxID=864073 RepID=A0AAI9N4G0_9BURK|nr:hypothetical protein [Herbaspirillum frisingense]EOA05242.1 hypothetical protein HFRIS_008871 [Herbaspirillum frisingense GSF30]